MPQITKLALGKVTFGHLHLPVILLKQLKDQPQMLNMFFIGTTENENVVEENEYTFAQQRV